MKKTTGRGLVLDLGLVAGIGGALVSLIAASREGGALVVAAGFAIVAACAAAPWRRGAYPTSQRRLGPIELMPPISLAALGILLLAWTRPFPDAAWTAVLLTAVLGFVATVALVGTTMAAGQLRIFRGYTRRQWNIILAGLGGTTFLLASSVFAADWPSTTGTVSGRHEVLAAACAMWVMLTVALAAQPLLPGGSAAIHGRAFALLAAAAGALLAGALLVSLAIPGSSAASRPELMIACATVALANIIATVAPRGSPWLEAETEGVLPNEAAFRLSLSWSLRVFLMIVAVLADWLIRRPL